MLFKRRKPLHQDVNEFNITINNYNGIFQILASNLVLPFASIFAKRLHASDFQVALLVSLPALVSALSVLPGAAYLQKCNNKKNVTGRFFIGARMFFLIFAFVPFAPKEYRAPLFIFLYGFMNLPGSIGIVSWQAFIAGLLPVDMRAGALAIRNKLSTLVGIATTLVTGWVLYKFPKGDAQRLVFYQFFFAAAFIFAIIEIYLFYKHRIPQKEECLAVEHGVFEEGSVTIKNSLNEIKKDRKYLTFCLCIMAFHFAWYLSAPTFPIYEIDYLGSNEAWTSILSATFSISSAIAYPYWGKFVNRKGNSLPLAIAALFMVSAPLSYPFINSMYMALPFQIINAIGFSGVGLIMLNTVFELSPSKNRTFYIAFYNTITNLLMAVAPFAGVAIMDAFDIRAVFLISAGGRIISAVLFFIRYKKEVRIPV